MAGERSGGREVPAQGTSGLTALDASLMVDTIDRRRGPSPKVRQVLENSADILVTTEACLTEAMYLAGSRFGWTAQHSLWQTIEAAEIAVLSVDLVLVQRLMRRYRDVPMDFADATLVDDELLGWGR